METHEAHYGQLENSRSGVHMVLTELPQAGAVNTLGRGVVTTDPRPPVDQLPLCPAWLDGLHATSALCTEHASRLPACPAVRWTRLELPGIR